MITIKIQVFSKDAQVGAHMEVDPIEGKSKCEQMLASQLVDAVKEALAWRASQSKHSRTIECDGRSEINADLKKEFGL